MTKIHTLILGFLILLFGQSSFSQTAIGLEVGINWSKYNPLPSTIENAGTGYNFGILIQECLGRNFAFVTNVSYVNKLRVSEHLIPDGHSYAPTETRSEFSHYSILLKKEFPVQSFIPYIIFGPRYEYLISATSTSNVLGSTISEDLTSVTNKSELTIEMGVGLQYSLFTRLSVFLDSKYSFGHGIFSTQLWSGFMFIM